MFYSAVVVCAVFLEYSLLIYFLCCIVVVCVILYTVSCKVYNCLVLDYLLEFSRSIFCVVKTFVLSKLKITWIPWSNELYSMKLYSMKSTQKLCYTFKINTKNKIVFLKVEFNIRWSCVFICISVSINYYTV